MTVLTVNMKISYSVDPTNLKFGEKKIFLEYLANHAMFIDVWDGDSLHLIGTATLQLKELLRQGKEAVQSTFELDIISVENDDDSRLYSGNTVDSETFFVRKRTIYGRKFGLMLLYLFEMNSTKMEQPIRVIATSSCKVFCISELEILVHL